MKSSVGNGEKLKLGEFFEILECMTPESIDDALQSARELDIPVGRAMVVRGLISNDQLTNLVQLHCLVRDGVLAVADAKDAYSLAQRRELPVRDALSNLGFCLNSTSGAMLGELLTMSAVIDQRALDDALALQRLTGLPIGRILHIDSCVPPYLMFLALELQQEIRSSKRSPSSAVNVLATFSNRARVKAKRNSAYSSRGDSACRGQLDVEVMLLESGICTQSELSIVTGFARVNGVQLIDALRYTGMVRPEILSAASALAGLVGDGYLDDLTARSIFNSLVNEEHSNVISWRPVSLYQFLMISGFFTAGDIRRITRSLIDSPREIEQVVGDTRLDLGSKVAMRKAIMKCIVDSANLERVLGTIDPESRSLITYARDLVSLVCLGRVDLDRAILSFARMRREREL